MSVRGTSARVLFVVLEGHGHVTPTVPLVSELARRGHAVDYACGPAYRDLVVAAGATWVPLPAMPPFVPPAEVGPGTVARFFRHFFAAMAATFPALREHVRTRRPDAVVYDATNWPGRLVARELGVPAVRTVPNLAENDTYTEVGDALLAGAEEHPDTRGLAEDVARFADEHGVALDVASTMNVTEACNLVFVPRAFQPGGAGFDARFRFLGPMPGGRTGTWCPPHPDLPVLYVSLGSIFVHRPAFYRLCLDAFGDGHFQVAMTIGDTDPAGLGAVPPTVQVRRWFPQTAVLRRATAFVTHAGMNSTMEAVACGVPMLAVPQMPEQALNADRVRDLRLGTRIDPATVSATGLRRALDDVVADPAVHAALAGMRAEAAEGGGPVAGADAIEEHLAPRRPSSGTRPAPDR